MSISLVQSTQGSSNYPPNNTPYGSNVTAGNVLVCAIPIVGNGSLGTVVVYDSLNGVGNPWTLLNTQYNDSVNSSWTGLFAFTSLLSGACTVEFTTTGGAYGNMIIAEFTGFAGTPTIDTGTYTENSGDSTAVAATVTTGQPNTLALAACGSNWGWASAPPTGWTGASTTQSGLYYQVAATAGSYNFDGTLGSSVIWDVVPGGIYGAVSGIHIAWWS